MGLIMALIISAAMGVVATLLVLITQKEAQVGPMTFVSNIVLSIVIGVIIALVLPLGKLGKALANAAKAYPPSFKFTLLNAISLSVGNTLIIGFLLSGFGVFMARRNIPPEVVKNMPFLPMWLGSFAKMLLPTLLVSYILAVVFSPIISKAVGLGGPGAGKTRPEE